MFYLYLVGSRRLRHWTFIIAVLMTVSPYFTHDLLPKEMTNDNAGWIVSVLIGPPFIGVILLYLVIKATIVAWFTKVAVDDVRTDYLNQDIRKQH